MKKNGLPDCNRQGKRGGADSDGTGGKTGAVVRPGGSGSFWLSAARERYQKHFFIIKFNFSIPVKAERSSRNKEGRRERWIEERRERRKMQEEEEEDKNTHPQWRNSF